MVNSMKKTFLFPTYFKKIGWAVILANVVLVVIFSVILKQSDFFSIKFPSIWGDMGMFDDVNSHWFQMVDADYLTTLLPALLMIGLCFVAFSREKVEDEYIVHIREHSLVWSVMIGCALYLFLDLFFYGFFFLYVWIFYIYVFLILFICKCHYELYSLKKSLKREEIEEKELDNSIQNPENKLQNESYNKSRKGCVENFST